MLENIDICKIPLMMERRTESRGFFMKKEKIWNNTIINLNYLISLLFQIAIYSVNSCLP